MGNKHGKSKRAESTALPTKIIFLDIDGVLNNAKSDVSQLYVMEPDLMKLLKKILQSVPGCGLVLSSTWRYTKTTRARALEFFQLVDLPSYISCTPNLGTNRVDEILCWLKENTNSDAFGIHNLAELPDITTSKYDDGMRDCFYVFLFELTLRTSARIAAETS
jgi:hypothetical protein